MFDLRGLTQKQVGGKVPVVLYDSLFSNKEKAIIGLVKMDMNNNVRVTYLCPNFNMTIRDFVKHIKRLNDMDNSKIVISN